MRQSSFAPERLTTSAHLIRSLCKKAANAVGSRTLGSALCFLQYLEAPKSSRWKLRARVGERTKWYDEPEEVGHA